MSDIIYLLIYSSLFLMSVVLFSAALLWIRDRMRKIPALNKPAKLISQDFKKALKRPIKFKIPSQVPLWIILIPLALILITGWFFLFYKPSVKAECLESARSETSILSVISSVSEYKTALGILYARCLSQKGFAPEPLPF